MSTISINGIRIYAFHGFFEVEQKIGQWYEVTVHFSLDSSIAEEKDELSGTVDYSIINELVLEQMTIKSKLIEHVGRRIITQIKRAYPNITKGTLSILKENPPVKGTLKNITITLNF